MAVKKSLLEIFEELIPIFELANIQIMERKGKIVLCEAGGSTVVLKKTSDENANIFSGEGKYGIILIAISKDQKNIHAILPEKLNARLSFTKNDNTISFSMSDTNGLKHQITLSPNSFTFSKQLPLGGNIDLWGSKEGIPLGDSAARQYYRLQLKENESIFKIEIRSNKDDTFITTKGTIEDKDGLDYFSSVPITDYKVALEQWIYDLCYPYQGISYFQDIIDAFESVLPCISLYLSSKYPFFGSIYGRTLYQDHSKDLLALCMNDLLVPLGMMKEEPMKDRYLRLRNKILGNK